MEGLKEVADFVRENSDFIIVCHYDADGLAAAGIAGKMLERLGKKFKFYPAKSLDPERIAEIDKQGNNFLFVDLGSNSIENLKQGMPGKKFAVVDHHKPGEKNNVPHFNPHFSGYNGASEISGAGSTYLVAKEIDEKNIDLAKMAIVGAVGDMQDATGELVGLNRKILEDSEKSGEIEVRHDLRLFGRHSRPLVQFLSYCTDPYLPGLTANETACKEFIQKLGIDLMKDDKWRYYCDLTEEEKKRFISAIYVHGKQYDTPEFILQSLIGEVYELTKEQDRTEVKDAKEFATVLNACGRHEKGEIGIMVCMGDRAEYFKKARTLLQKHRQMLRDGIEFAQTKGITEMPNIYILDGRGQIKDTIIGIIAGMLYGTNTIKQNKPIIALAIDEAGKLKISGRGTWNLVRKGLDLGKAMKIAAGPFNNSGGGHNIAAGARVELNQEEEFLKKLDEEIGKQLTAAPLK